MRLLGEEEDDGARPSQPASSRKTSKGGGGKKGKGKGKGGKASAKKSPTASAGVPGQAGERAVEGWARVDFSHLCFEYHRCEWCLVGALIDKCDRCCLNQSGTPGEIRIYVDALKS